MDIRRKLEHKFSEQTDPHGRDDDTLLHKYLTVAEGYADIEGVLAVLSDLRHRASYVFCGRFADAIMLDKNKCHGKIPSIWEQEIFDTLIQQDLENKLLSEFLFYNYIRNKPKALKFTLCLHQKLRMRGRAGGFVDTLHRVYYIPSANGNSIRFALCLYGPMTAPFQGNATIVNKSDGTAHKLEEASGEKILTKQETTVLRLIAQGKSSKEAAEILNVSVHTISRHRQNINTRLQVHNSIEACRIAQSLSIL